ncbi:hypothetical protein N8751_01470, partial [bacterium]|nr:hypothetical protein [bacterium]
IKDITQAISVLNKVKSKLKLDCIILTRGGGSIDDLWIFNHMSILESIYHSIVPIFTGIGHDIDFSLSDKISDKSFITPTDIGRYIENNWSKKQIEIYNQNQLSNINEVMLKLNSLHSMITSNTTNTNDSIRDQYQKIVDIVANITGKANKSAHQGQIGENYVLNILKDAYPRAIIDLSVSDAHQADIHMNIDGLPDIFVEVKNYTNTVPSKEVEKFKNDLVRNNISLGLFLSFGQKIN